MVEIYTKSEEIGEILNGAESLARYRIEQARKRPDIDNGKIMQDDMGRLTDNLKILGTRLPESIVLGSEKVKTDYYNYLEQKRWLSETNKLVKVRVCVEKIINVGEGKLRTVTLPKDEQTEEIIGELESKEWLVYAPRLIGELKKKILPSPIPQK